MEAVYSWSVSNIMAKPTFKDKHGNVRTNVLKRAALTLEGKLGSKKHKITDRVDFNIFDLSNFRDYTEVSKDELVNWCLDTIDPRQKQLMINEVAKVIGDEENIDKSTNGLVEVTL